jgi:hypothetical protein
VAPFSTRIAFATAIFIKKNRHRFHGFHGTTAEDLLSRAYYGDGYQEARRTYNPFRTIGSSKCGNDAALAVPPADLALIKQN